MAYGLKASSCHPLSWSLLHPQTKTCFFNKPICSVTVARLHFDIKDDPYKLLTTIIYKFIIYWWLVFLPISSGIWPKSSSGTHNLQLSYTASCFVFWNQKVLINFSRLLGELFDPSSKDYVHWKSCFQFLKNNGIFFLTFWFPLILAWCSIGHKVQLNDVENNEAYLFPIITIIWIRLFWPQ